MEIGKVIRKYRKEQGMTQEEMAKRLGVTAPAVNKWERGSSTPDISLLAPIARMFHISVDELLSYKEELTIEEIAEYIKEADGRLKEHPYDEVFRWGKSVLEEYPDCCRLIWQMALTLDANRLFRNVKDLDLYDEYVISWYKRAMESKDDEVCYAAANAMFALCMRKDNYVEAEKCLEYFSAQNPERKRKKADLAWKQGKKDEAYRAQEELIFSEFQMLTMSLQSLYVMALEENHLEKAHYLVKKQKEIAKISEMGEYHEAASGLELATIEQDVDLTIEVMEKMLNCIPSMWDFKNSPLYEHMKFKEVDEKFVTDLRENLVNSFRDEETFGYMQGDRRWWNIVNQNEIGMKGQEL